MGDVVASVNAAAGYGEPRDFYFLKMGYPHCRMVFGWAQIMSPLERGQTQTRMPPVSGNTMNFFTFYTF